MLTGSVHHKILSSMLLLVFCFVSLLGYASSSQYFGQSVMDMGEAYSGGAALATDASTDYTNPAGMVRLAHSQLQFYTDHVWANKRFTGTLQQSGPEKITPLDNVDNGGGGTIPGFHAVAKLGDRWAVGLSAVLSFAADNSNSNAVLKDSVSSMVTSYFDITPNLAYKLSQHWSIGGGIDAIFSHTKDQFFYMNSDDYAKIDMKGTDMGWNAGLLYVAQSYRLGLAYRSAVSSHLDGTVKTAGDLFPLIFPDQKETGESQIPATWRLSGLYQLSPTWVAMTTIYYTQWQQAEKVVISNGGSAAKSIYYTDHDNKNTLSIAFGATHQFNQQLGVAFGVIYDPQLSDNHVLPSGSNKGKRIAVNNSSYGLTAGIHYQRNKEWRYALAMLYVLPTKQNVYNSTAGQLPIMDGQSRNSIFEIALATSRVF